ncbi:fungal-specific transcription factor domain-containing protein [Lasiosphaeria ovina]|uniref:Fungal-specific transcription factor domain-containing protein n=1 Tax=Lasiosphaeria ovina TaxID=92902 RepID=A0AAE0MY92_9PEZI|nr:fungal-specific transcription factor domain-containing protein [Lasiosphaeria ovina]
MADPDGGVTQKRCWNCRSRKVACDRAVPACLNCQRRGQDCLGYGIKLSWPRANDEKRATRGDKHHVLPILPGNAVFINASNQDIEVWNSSLQTRGDAPKEPLAMTFSLDPFLDTHKYSALSQIISTSCEDMSDLYNLLIRMSLTSEAPPAVATRHAIAALSYQHLERRQEALAHHGKALSALQVSIDSLSQLMPRTDSVQAFQAMAASMLLNIYESLNFDASSLSWAIFFCGVKKIANLVHRPHTTYEGDPALILDWVFYHDTFYKFSIRHWPNKEDQQVQLAAQEKIISKAVFSPMRQIILKSSGCSLEMLDIICHVIDAVRDRDDPSHLSAEHLGIIRTLQLRLDRVKQVLQNQKPPAHPWEQRADLYRLAAYIYLERMALCRPRGDPKVASLIDQAMSLLSTLGICERPWPVFVIALEARTDEERRSIVDLLGTASDLKPLGSIPLLKRMIHAAWVQQDLGLGGDGGLDPLPVYNAVISGNRVPPAFT